MSEQSIEILGRGVWVDAGRLLVCENLEDGYFFLPGGHVEAGESVSDAVGREMMEEIGVDVSVGSCGLVLEQRFVQKRSPRHEVSFVFHVEPAAGVDPETVVSREDHIAFRWVDLAAVTDLDLRPAATKAWILSNPASDADRPEWLSVDET